jgi:hypothetical protein
MTESVASTIVARIAAELAVAPRQVVAALQLPGTARKSPAIWTIRNCARSKNA